MAALLSERTSRTESSETKKSSRDYLLLLCGAFFTGFVPCLLHNLFFCESRIMLATDGKHFLTTVGLLTEFLKQHAFTPFAAQFLTESQLPGHIIFDGPLMSLIYSPVFLVLNKIPTPRDWFTLAMGQSTFHAISTALLTAITLRVTGSPLFAAMAALLFGLYPPAVLQSGHFMSEIPVTTILLALLLALSGKSKKQFLSWTFAGVCTALVALSKPALIPCVFVACAVAVLKIATGSKVVAATDDLQVRESVSSFGATPGAMGGAWHRPYGEERSGFGERIIALRAVSLLQVMTGAFTWLTERRIQLAGLALGFVLVTLPWGIFSFKSTGSFLPTAQRQPIYNVVTGWNTEANGWAYNPPPPLTKIFNEEDGPLPTAMGIWMSRPQESALLAISKLSRLTACPWNDFKGRALGLDENAQLLWHRLIIAFSAFGFGMYVFCARRYLSQEQRTILELSFAIIATHITYLMVECQPRYLFSAMPFTVLLAVYGIWQVSRLSFQDPLRRLIIVSSVACALGSTAFLLHSENLSRLLDMRMLKERNHTLGMNDFVEKDIDLTGVTVPSRIKSVVLLVDGDKNLEKSKIEVNGVELNGKLMSTMHFDAEHYGIYDQLREFGPAMRIAVEDFRQWRAIPLEPKLINWQGSNHIVLTSLAKSATVYGDRKNTRFALSPDYCNYGILAAAPVAAGAESRYTDPVLTAQDKQASYMTTRAPFSDDQTGKGDLRKDGDLTATDSAKETTVVETSREALKDSLRIRLLVTLADDDASGGAKNNSASGEAKNKNNSASGEAKNKNNSASGGAKSNSASGGETNNSASGGKTSNSASGGETSNSASDSEERSGVTTIDVSRKSFDRLLWDSSSDNCLRINKVILYGARTVASEIPLPPMEQGSHIQVRISGELKALKNPGEVGLLCALKGKNDRVQILGKTPRALSAKSEWHKFQIADLVPLSSLSGKAESLELALYPCPWMEGQYGVSRRAADALFRNIKVEVSQTDLPSLSGRRIIY